MFILLFLLTQFNHYWGNGVKKQMVFICVNYLNCSDTIQFVQSLLRQDQAADIHIVVVDNSENEEEFTNLKNRLNFEQVMIIESKTNLGYFGGAKYGLQYYSSLWEIPEWIIISNTDLEIQDPEFCNKLWSNWKGSETVIAPSIVSTHTGLDENPHMVKRPSIRRILFYRTLYRFYYLTLFYQYLSCFRNYAKLKLIDKIPWLSSTIKSRSNEKLIYAPHGSFIIFNRNFFKNADIDFGAFLFAEEIFVGELARNSGVKIVYAPSLIVIHHSHSTTGIIKNRKMIKFKNDSYSYLYHEFFQEKVIHE